jgi:hypothetical protein
MTRQPVYLAASNLIAAAFRARARGMTGAEARTLQAAESARIPEGHPLARALDVFAREVGFAHGNALRISAAAHRLHHTAALCLQPEMPARVDIYG